MQGQICTWEWRDWQEEERQWWDWSACRCTWQYCSAVLQHWRRHLLGVLCICKQLLYMWCELLEASIEEEVYIRPAEGVFEARRMRKSSLWTLTKIWHGLWLALRYLMCDQIFTGLAVWTEYLFVRYGIVLQEQASSDHGVNSYWWFDFAVLQQRSFGYSQKGFSKQVCLSRWRTIV